MYEAEYCDRCIHRVSRDEECPVLFLHLMWNYEQCRDELKKETLELFIPQEGVFNEKCKMWVDARLCTAKEIHVSQTMDTVTGSVTGLTIGRLG